MVSAALATATINSHYENPAKGLDQSITFTSLRPRPMVSSALATATITVTTKIRKGETITLPSF